MTKLNFKDIEEKGLLLYKYIRGSHAYGLEKPDGTSDIDEGAVFIEPQEWLLGLGKDIQEQISDERNDTTWYSLKKYMNMLLTSNPTVLESLFIDDKFVLYEHPIFTKIKKNRDKFLTKQAFKPLLGYSIEQIRKCRGLNKKIVNPVTERLQPLDFAYTHFKQGSTKILNWLEHRNLKQEYCGLVNIPNMENHIGVYYDWGQYFLDENITVEDLFDIVNLDKRPRETSAIIFDIKNENGNIEELNKELKNSQLFNMVDFIISFYRLYDNDKMVLYYALNQWFLNNKKPIGYKGMVSVDGKSNELRLSSVSKDEIPICYISYNKNGYSQHCRMYKEYQDWVKFRNPERFNDNKDKEFDRKNVAHAVRLMHMGIELAKTGQFNVNRTEIDRDFILKIRLGETTYDEIISYLDSKQQEMKDAMDKSDLPNEIDVNFVNNLLIDLRKEFNSGTKN